MNRFLSVFAISSISIAFACSTPVKEKTELTTQDKIAGVYGADVSENNITNASQMVSIVEEQGTFEGKIIGEIDEVCSSKGCWLTMDLPNGKSMRVTFKDYEFFVPKNSQGFPVILDGVATLTETDVETQRHYAKDAGKSADEIAKITEPKREITFEAKGVKIKDKA
ncbi:DUF4920 domain-containing protein [Algoriphagus sp.]|uniref:DUF4920 domain-containing protein n=1 Tax=Algoriphagus sp. TaxID=1872435 RepID=UPI0025ECC9FC|nr:DUF4920 domain-containing protein [Algoriphagus sp.]